MDSAFDLDSSLVSYRKFCECILKDLKDSDKQVKKTLSDFAVAHIMGFAQNTDSLGSCIAAILLIVPYLSHDSEKVRNIAAKILCTLIKKAAEFLADETDPRLILQYGKTLLDVIKKIETLESKGTISLGNSSKTDLEDAKHTLKMLRISGGENEDEFICSDPDDFLSRLFKNFSCDGFVAHKDRTSKDLKLNNSPPN